MKLLEDGFQWALVRDNNGPPLVWVRIKKVEVHMLAKDRRSRLTN